MFFSWVLSVVAGVVVGVSIPPSWGVEFTIPLAFLVMLVNTINCRLLFAVALVSGAVAVLSLVLPLNIGFIVAVVAGVGFGLFIPTVLQKGADK